MKKVVFLIMILLVSFQKLALCKAKSGTTNAPGHPFQKQISGKISNRETSSPVPYATVSIMGANIAINADAEGFFLFSVPVRLPDTLLISSVGFDDEKVAIDSYQHNILIEMKPHSIMLDSLRLIHYRGREVLNNFFSCSSHFYTTSGFVTQVAQLFSAPKVLCRLKSLEFCKEAGYDRFRFRLYTVDSSGRLKPGLELSSEVIEVRSGNRRVKVDLSDKNIVIPGKDFFVAIEWLFLPENAHKTKYRGRDGRKVRALEYGPYLGIRSTTHENSAYTCNKSFQGRWFPAGMMRLLLSADIEIP